ATPTGLPENDISVAAGSPSVHGLTVRETITTIRDGKVAKERVRDRQATTSEVGINRTGIVPMTIRAIDVSGREQVFRHTEATIHGNVDMDVVVSPDGAVRQVVAKRQGEVVAMIDYHWDLKDGELVLASE